MGQVNDPLTSTVDLLVRVQLRQEDGAVKSSHRPLSVEDRDRMDSWPSGGQVQVAHGLFVEAIRREAYTMMLSQLSAGKPPAELTPEDLEAHIKAHLIHLLDNFAKSAAEEALSMLDL